MNRITTLTIVSSLGILLAAAGCTASFEFPNEDGAIFHVDPEAKVEDIAAEHAKLAEKGTKEEEAAKAKAWLESQGISKE